MTAVILNFRPWERDVLLRANLRVKVDERSVWLFWGEPDGFAIDASKYLHLHTGNCAFLAWENALAAAHRYGAPIEGTAPEGFDEGAWAS
ncbi:hypothetical protein [Sphingobium boeckii]|uniref:Uncharacterized protein n=1 Tax=Sphingobium boeckii TaxID=1082345 RepID=A0A7W9EE54_9SPHN|nr:hypothetical protein [Sphingobium boeckii]MBB5685654.1 hypothetical protein [Sphingobium boeckii]